MTISDMMKMWRSIFDISFITNHRRKSSSRRLKMRNLVEHCFSHYNAWLFIYLFVPFRFVSSHSKHCYAAHLPSQCWLTRNHFALLPFHFQRASGLFYKWYYEWPSVIEFIRGLERRAQMTDVYRLFFRLNEQHTCSQCVPIHINEFQIEGTLRAVIIIFVGFFNTVE